MTVAMRIGRGLMEAAPDCFDAAVNDAVRLGPWRVGYSITVTRIDLCCAPWDRRSQ